MGYHAQDSIHDLAGTWSFSFQETPPRVRFRFSRALQATGLPVYAANVPGNFELDLQANGLIEEPFYGMNIAGLRRYERAHIWYWRTFRATPRPAYQAELVFEGLDCFADIYLNGQRIGSTDNMLIEHVLPVDPYLVDGENELFIHLRPALEEARRHDYPPLLMAGRANWDALHVRKAPHMYGWDIMPRALSAGLWRPVWLRYRPAERLEELYLETQQIARRPGRRLELALHYRVRTRRAARRRVRDRDQWALRRFALSAAGTRTL